MKWVSGINGVNFCKKKKVVNDSICYFMIIIFFYMLKVVNVCFYLFWVKKMLVFIKEKGDRVKVLFMVY